MSLHYLLDGYNIIKQSDFLSSGASKKDVRSGLVRFITDKNPCGSSNNKVTIVFDGKSDMVGFMPYGESTRKYGMEVIFTSNESADDKIKELVSSSKNPKMIVVVSDDKEIQFFIRSCGARPMGVVEFIKKGNPVKKNIDDSTKIGLSYHQIAQINAELKKIWLDK